MNDTKPWQQQEILHELYWEQGLSLPAMAEELDASVTTLRRWMLRHDIETRDPPSRRTARFETRRDGYERWQTTVNGECVDVLVHRLLAVSEFGLEAVCDKDVHHESGVPWDNRPSNLELLGRTEHIAHHRAESHGCEPDDIPWRDEEILLELYQNQGLSTAEIGERLGCDRVTVWNWLRRFGIPTRTKGGKEVSA